MTLKDFLENCVVRNTLVRLWIPCEVQGMKGHKALCDTDGHYERMEHQILNAKTSLCNFLFNEVEGVTDIVYHGMNPEAVNIIIIPGGEMDLYDPAKEKETTPNMDSCLSQS